MTSDLRKKERRLTALRSIANTLVAKGRALVSVWAFEQERSRKRSHYIKRSPGLGGEVESTGRGEDSTEERVELGVDGKIEEKIKNIDSERSEIDAGERNEGTSEKSNKREDERGQEKEKEKGEKKEVRTTDLQSDEMVRQK